MRIAIIIISFFFLQEFKCQDGCDPVTECIGAAPGTQVANPDDCESYFVCMANGLPSDVAFPCPDDQYFYWDSVPARCVLAGYCPDPCDPTPTSCVYDCGTTDQLIPVPGNCNKYLNCSDDIRTEYSCDGVDGALYFNGVKCVRSITECCDQCDIGCHTQFMQIPFAGDCKQFSYCDDSVPPVVVVTSTCQSGTYFDSFTSKCVAGTSCTIGCLVQPN